jgi:Pentapeptide repeats (8 copies)
VLGGIYALERIARDSNVDYSPIMEILTAYVRGRVRIREGEALREDAGVPNDVQAVLAVLGRRKRPARGIPGLDLTRTDLRGAKLPGAQLYDARLDEADLSHADLRDAKLIGAKLKGATFTAAHLARADFRDAIDADFSGSKRPHCTPAAESCEDLDEPRPQESTNKPTDGDADRRGWPSH